MLISTGYMVNSTRTRNAVESLVSVQTALGRPKRGCRAFLADQFTDQINQKCSVLEMGETAQQTQDIETILV